MRNLKKVLCMSLAAVMILSLCSCGKKDNKVDDTQLPGFSDSTDTGDDSKEQVDNQGDSSVENEPATSPDGSEGEPDASGEDKSTVGPEVPDASEPEDGTEGTEGSEGSEDGKVKQPTTVDTLADEEVLVKSKYGQSDITSEGVVALLGEGFDWVSDIVIADIAVVLNYYSYEGVMRTLESGYVEELEAAAQAMVIVCHMIEVPYENLWTNGYMSQDAAEAVIAQIG